MIQKGQKIMVRRKTNTGIINISGTAFHVFEEDGVRYVAFWSCRTIDNIDWDIPCCAEEKECTPVEEPKPRILYECDRRACSRCSYPDCQHTDDISHAKNFHVCGKKIFVEGEIGE